VRVVPPVVGPEVGEMDTRVKADPALVALSSVAVVFTFLRDGLQAAEKARTRTIPRKVRLFENVNRLTNVHIRSY
jgi:hypothetical protein